jgi:uncharacterized membrane protein YdjX (TVP38/TMEM64 family)
LKKHNKKLMIFLAIIICFLLFRYFNLGEYFTFESIKGHSGELKAYLNENFALFTIAFILFYIISAALSVPWATLLTMLSGFLYGTILGVFIVNIGATIGSLLAFWAARYLFRDSLKSKYGDRLEKVDKELRENGASYMLFSRLIPAFPFFLINIAAGLTEMSTKRFVWTTMIGIIPGSAVYAFAGESLNSIDSASGILTPQILLAFCFLGLFALVPTVHKKIRYKKNL